MALTPIGNITYVNQNAQLGAIQHANNMSKPEFAHIANMQEFVDKIKDVQEVSPTPQNEPIDPNNSDKGKQEKEEDKEKQDKENEQENENLATQSSHLLDVRA